MFVFFCIALCIVVARLCFVLPPPVRRGDPGDHLQVEPTPIPRATVRGRVLVAEAGPRAWSDLLDLRNRRPMARTVQEVNSHLFVLYTCCGTAFGYCFWLLLLVTASGYCFWFLLLVTASGYCFWLLLLVPAFEYKNLKTQAWITLFSLVLTHTTICFFFFIFDLLNDP
jgi:hypothetical protein